MVTRFDSGLTGGTRLPIRLSPRHNMTKPTEAVASLGICSLACERWSEQPTVPAPSGARWYFASETLPGRQQQGQGLPRRGMGRPSSLKYVVRSSMVEPCQ